MAGPVRRLAGVAVILALVASCGQARAGNALPKGEDASSYVGAKFEQAMAGLQTRLANTHDIASSLDFSFRVDDKWFHNVITTTRAGSPESRAFHNRSLRNPDEVIDGFTPAEGTVEYTYLGAVYRSLAPTPWISTPKAEAGLVQPCAWTGLTVPCKMANAVGAAHDADKRVVRSAKSRTDGRIELTVDVTLGIFLDQRVINLPPSLRTSVGGDLEKSAIPTVIALNNDGSLASFVMNAKLEGGGHRVELLYDFKFTGRASAQDFPRTPDPAQLTVLPDKAAADDFKRRLNEYEN